MFCAFGKKEKKIRFLKISEVFHRFTFFFLVSICSKDFVKKFSKFFNPQKTLGNFPSISLNFPWISKKLPHQLSIFDTENLIWRYQLTRYDTSRILLRIIIRHDMYVLCKRIRWTKEGNRKYNCVATTIYAEKNVTIAE